MILGRSAQRMGAASDGQLNVLRFTMPASYEVKIKDPHPYPKALSEKIMSKRNLVIKPSKIHPKSIWDIDSRRKFHVDFDSGVRLA